jgi:putative MATE family efflux protein
VNAPQAASSRVEVAPERTGGDAAVARIVHGPLAAGVARFGLPLVVGMALHTTFNLVDMAMIGQLPNGGAGLAALGICDMVAAVATILSNGVSTATVALIAQRSGAGDDAGVARATRQSLLLVAALSLVFGGLGVFGSDLVIRGVMRAQGEVAALASAYLKVLLGGCFSIFFLLQITAILRARGRGTAAAVLLVAGNVLNVALNPFLIFGTGAYPDLLGFCAPLGEALGAPRLGVVGAAWATLVGRTVPVLIGAAMLVATGRGPRLGARALLPEAAELRRLVRIAWPASAQFVLRVSSILVFLAMLGAHYTTPSDASALTAYSICLRLETMALFVGMGWGAAASTYVGVNLGAGQLVRARRAGLWAAGFNAAFMVALTALYLVFSRPIMGFFDDSPAVLAAGDEYLWRVGATYAVLGVGVVLSQAMSGAGATLPSLVLDAAVLLGFTVPLAWLVTGPLGLARPWLWNAIAVGHLVSALAFSVYYLRGRALERATTVPPPAPA